MDIEIVQRFNMSKSVRFNAGKVQYDEETNKCTPLPHKGVVSIKPSEDDEGFYDFSWSPKSNSGNVPKDELLIIPGDISLKKVTSCKTGRIIALTFLSSGAKHLYWLQDLGDDDELDKWTEKDCQIFQKIEEIITPIEEDEDEEEAATATEQNQQTDDKPQQDQSQDTIKEKTNE